MDSEGIKFDHGKARYDLLPPEGLEAVSRILTFGAKKYSDRNWELGMDWGRVFGAGMRHLWAWWGGENKDPETGMSHLWHAATCIFFLIAYEQRGVGKDTRDQTIQDRPEGSLQERLDKAALFDLHNVQNPRSMHSSQG